VIITLNVHRNVGGLYEPTGERITLQFGDFLPATGDTIGSEEGQRYRVLSREWLPGTVVLDVVEIQEAA
jgi:hypothetical protein